MNHKSGAVLCALIGFLTTACGVLDARDSDKKDVKKGTLVQTFYAHDENISGVAVLPDGENAVSTSWDGSIKTWALATGTQTSVIEQQYAMFVALDISPDGKNVVTANQGDRPLSDDHDEHFSFVRMWELSSGSEVRQYFADDYLSAEDADLSTDGSLVAIGSRTDEAIVYKTEDGSVVKKFGGLDLGATTVALSPDNKILVSGDRKKVYAWEIESGRELWTADAKEAVGAVFSPDGKLVAVGDFYDHNVRLFDATSGQLVRTVAQYDRFGVALVAKPRFSPDGTRVATAYLNRVSVWDVASGEEVVQVEADEWVHSFDFFPSGDRIITGGTGSIGIWSL